MAPSQRAGYWIKWPLSHSEFPPPLLVYREAFAKIGLFDENLPYCDDYDMLLRLAANFEFEVVPLPLIKYRLHPQQVSKNEGPVLTDHIAVFNKALKLPRCTGRDLPDS